MASWRILFKALILAAAVAAAGGASAATFAPKRGINMDIWNVWPAEEQWARASVLLPFPEWRRTVDARKLAELRATGFDFVRVPIDPAPFLAPSAARFHDRLFREVEDTVRTLNRAGLKAVIDMHLIAWGPDRTASMGTVMASPENFAAYAALVGRMAATLSAFDPELVAFELMNEPQIDCEPGALDTWSMRQAELWSAARGAAPDLTLILTGACFSKADALSRLDPRLIPDANVIWTFHSYDPFVLTHQGATWAGDFVVHVSGLAFPPFAMPDQARDAAVERIRANIRRGAVPSRQPELLSYLEKQLAGVDTPAKLDAAMEAPFRTVADWAQMHGIPFENILLGEFGMIRQEWQRTATVPAASRAAYVGAMIDHAENYGFAWSVWGYGGAFGVVETFAQARAEPDILDVIRALPEAAPADPTVTGSNPPGTD
ncbi:MAG: glycosyl hydrolase [Mesorhizobium amorphae]|nr:MAG: glycosyl hydrolase [Mesorhizobium amorphae]